MEEASSDELVSAAEAQLLTLQSAWDPAQRLAAADRTRALLQQLASRQHHVASLAGVAVAKNHSVAPDALPKYVRVAIARVLTVQWACGGVCGVPFARPVEARP
jgi:hypothetical protein